MRIIRTISELEQVERILIANNGIVTIMFASRK